MQHSNDKIQKVLSTAGIASRRTIEQWIQQKRILVNDTVAHIGQRVNCYQDTIKIDGHLIDLQLSKNLPVTKILLYNKPVGVICTRNDEQNRKNIFSFLPHLETGRWISIGRLDINSSGLLLLTNNGELAYRLMHPKYKILRGYLVRVLGKVSQDNLEMLKNGLELTDGMANFADIHHMQKEGFNQWFYVSLMEGRKREVRRLFEAIDCKVNRLIRINYGDISLPKDLRSNRSVLLSQNKVKKVLHSVGL
jgi:23S rRNA pseudouridine2605 synthase